MGAPRKVDSRRQRLIRDLYLDGDSTHQIARFLVLNQETVWAHLKRLGVLRRASGHPKLLAVAKLCEHCAKNPARHRSKLCWSCGDRKATKVYGRYRLTAEDFRVLQETQNGRCAICARAVELVVDHCHETDKVRGLLCRLCNTGLGMFKDQKDLLIKAKEYLDVHT